MNRRELLKTWAGAAAYLLGLAGCTALSLHGKQTGHRRKAKTTEKGTDYVTDNGKLAGLTLKELRQQYRYDLFDDFLPFMEKYVIDHKFGGFMCNTDREGTNLSTNKKSWYLGRGVWVYSFLYNELAHEEKYLEVARKSVEFIMRNQPEGDNLWAASYTRDGKPILSVERDIYGDLFIANGLAEYARVPGNEDYWYMAKDILLRCIRIYDSPDYAYKVTYLRAEPPPIKGPRVLGHWMVILRLATQMLEFKSDSEVEAIARRCVDAIMNYHYNSQFGLINEVVNHDLSRTNDDYAQFVYTGHSIETLWMVMFEAHRRKDRELFERTALTFKRHLEVAWDDVYGGFFRGLKNVDENTWIVDKVLWLQEEVLIGTLFIVEHTGAQWAKDWFSKTFTYVQENYPLKKHGYALWNLYADRKVTFKKEYSRVGNFHHPRHLMLNLLSIERMIKRGGKVSGSFV